MTRALRYAALLALAAPFAGCGSGSHHAAPHRLDATAVERGIAGSILHQRHVYALVACPAVAQQAGASFTCSAKLDVGAYPVKVTQTDSNGHVSWNTSQPLNVLNPSRVERAIVTSIRRQRGLKAKADCPRQVLQQAGLTFTCTATVAGKPHVFDVKQTDDGGHVSYVARS